MQYRINLKAGIPLRQELSGTTFVLVDLGAAVTIDLKIEIKNFAAEEFRAVKRGLKISGPDFTSCLLTAAVDCAVEVVTSRANIDVNYTDSQAVNATIVGKPTVYIDASQIPLPVSNDRGAVGNPVYVSGITYSDAPAATLQDNAAVAVTSAGQTLVTANAARRGLRFTNIGTDPVALGFMGITWDKRCII